MLVESKIEHHAHAETTAIDEDVDIQATELLQPDVIKQQNYMFGKMSGAPWTKKESIKIFHYNLIAPSRIICIIIA
jgi:hypothetical protein